MGGVIVGEVIVGMVIVGVNGEDMRNKPLETVTGTIRSSGRPIELEFSMETENYAARSDDDARH